MSKGWNKAPRSYSDMIGGEELGSSSKLLTLSTAEAGRFSVRYAFRSPHPTEFWAVSRQPLDAAYSRIPALLEPPLPSRPLSF
jgi:hypothetical protein